ncbi:MAG: methyltransferase domain-containing protein [Candidatus Lokiarchaeota archaeon]|nr:methyltransferase domain-containing protein [Candidatus Lokiarchaeota archaeon]
MKRSIRNEDIRRIYSETARRYEIILGIYKILGVRLSKWRTEAFERLPGLTSPKMLDVACGTGANFSHLIKRYPDYQEIVGIDYTPQMLARAKKRIKENNWHDISLKLVDAKKMTKVLRDEFDLVVSTYSLSIIPDSPTVLKEIRKVLKTDGLVMLLDCQKFDGMLEVFNPLAIFLSTKLGGNEETYSVPVREIASNMFELVSENLIYSGLFYECLFRKRSISER